MTGAPGERRGKVRSDGILAYFDAPDERTGRKT